MYEDLQSITTAMNELLAHRELGQLQDFRKALKPLSKKPSNKVFPKELKTPKGHTEPIWVFHHGGRQELQFNMGFDQDADGRRTFRYGVAFSFETGGHVDDPIGPLVPWVRRFNDALGEFEPVLPGLLKWRWSNGRRVPDGPPRPVEDHEIAVGEFIFYGWTKALPLTEADLREVAAGLNALLPLYLAALQDDAAPSASGAGRRRAPARPFTPRAPVGGEHTTARRSKTSVDVSLRHNLLQQALYALLVAEHGTEMVSAEHQIGRGCQVDLAVLHDDGSMTLYEIKAAGSARQCIREALGQLLEYGFWPGESEPRELVVVGEHDVGDQGQRYLDGLRAKFEIPVRYQRVRIDDQ